jgi:hypothetical protein
MQLLGGVTICRGDCRPKMAGRMKKSISELTSSGYDEHLTSQHQPDGTQPQVEPHQTRCHRQLGVPNGIWQEAWGQRLGADPRELQTLDQADMGCRRPGPEPRRALGRTAGTWTRTRLTTGPVCLRAPWCRTGSGTAQQARPDRPLSRQRSCGQTLRHPVVLRRKSRRDTTANPAHGRVFARWRRPEG